MCSGQAAGVICSHADSNIACATVWVKTGCLFVLVIGIAASIPIGSAEQASPAARPADARWWKREPIRFLQTNLSETDSTVDPHALVAAVADFGANTFLMNMGGIVAQYPTRVPFHYPERLPSRRPRSLRRCRP